MRRVVLLLPTTTYRSDFVEAARSLGLELLTVSERSRPADEAGLPWALSVDFADPAGATDDLVEMHASVPFDAVIATDQRGVVIASMASERLGFPHNTPEAAAATVDKLVMRRRLAATEVPQPRFALVPADGGEAAAHAAVESVGGFPVVAKPLHLSGSQGVIRVDDATELSSTIDRVRAIACDETAAVLIERYTPGFEVAVEGLLSRGVLEVLAVFDKPDPMIGPYFEETIYVTPSRLPAEAQRSLARVAEDAARALGLAEGPVHAELRIDLDATPGEPARAPISVIEVAARSIGGLCSRSLRFGLGVSLEQLIVRHAVGEKLPPLRRERRASGVMMLPIGRRGGVLGSVEGLDAVRAMSGIDGIEITVPIGARVVPLPEGDRYLGFMFAHGPTPATVEETLRAAHRRLAFHFDADNATVPTG